jgi:hypothetical protein
MVAAKSLEAAQALEQEEKAPAEETAIEPRLAGETDPV